MSKSAVRRRGRWLRSALAHDPAQQRTAVAAMPKTIFAQEAKTDAETQCGVVAEPICRVLPIAPSPHRQRALEAREPERASGRSKTDAALRVQVSSAAKRSQRPR